MKKIVFTFLVAVAMTMSLSVTTVAATTEISGAWWTAWTPGYEVADSAQFTIEVQGGENNWNNVSAVFTNVPTSGTMVPADESADYKEYVVVRADSWGWGGGDNLSADGNAIEYTTTLEDANADGDVWDDFKAIMADATMDAVVTKTADGIELKYDVTGVNGKSFTYTATTKVDTSAGLYVFFVCDTSVVKVTTDANTGTIEATQAPTQEVTQAPTQEATQAPTQEVTQAPTQEATQAPTEEVTNDSNNEDGMNPIVIAIIAVIAVAVIGGAVVVLKKKK